MSRKLISIGAAVAVAASALAPAAGAADNAAAPLKVTGAYLYLDHLAASNQDFVRVVFRTADQLPRRSDGMIQAGVSIEGVGHSLGTARKGAPIYTGASEIKGHSIPKSNGAGSVTRIGAKVGRTYTVVISLRDGQKVTKHLKLRAERKGDDSGKPLVRY
jgi:hypothetical protein